jgi:hypothetical protein
MEVAIRAINWIVSINFFSEIFDTDQEFKDEISASLTQHAEYIFRFPEIYENGLTTNHTTASFAGLLFLGLTLKGNPNSSKWIESAINGLENCMKDQIYDDGSDFEASIPYHRLVLELFAYSTILSLSNNLYFSHSFMVSLFKMFEFVAAYIDKGGNVPQVGDNDSGRVIIFLNFKDQTSMIQEDRHSYLLNIGSNIFDYSFLNDNQKEILETSRFLPKINKIKLNDLNLIPRTVNRSISFENSGYYFLKNSSFSFLLSCSPIGQNGKGGHNHLDVGSYTLSLNGMPIIVDPGTAVYSPDENLRNRFRSYSYHNTLHTEKDDLMDWRENGLWSLKKYYSFKILEFNQNNISLEINYTKDKNNRTRHFDLSNTSLEIKEIYNGNFYSRINLHPSVMIIKLNNDSIILDKFLINLKNIISYDIHEYLYSPAYGVTLSSKCIIISSTTKADIKVAIKH